ncbi:MAG: hypothetical protein V3T58_03330 [Candidatus Hydrothermarchaeales archaeon]
MKKNFYRGLVIFIVVFFLVLPNVYATYDIKIIDPSTLTAETHKIDVAPGKFYDIEFTIEYEVEGLTKISANIVPDSKDKSVWQYAHFDTMTNLGKKGVTGSGQLTITLGSKAPLETGMYEKKLSVGLHDPDTWETIESKGYTFTLNVTSELKPTLPETGITIKNNFDDQTHQSIFNNVNEFTQMIENAIPFSNSPDHGGIFIDSLISLNFENPGRITKVTGYLKVEDYTESDLPTNYFDFAKTGDGIYKRNVIIKDIKKRNFDFLKDLFSFLSLMAGSPGTKAPLDTLVYYEAQYPSITLEKVVVELEDGTSNEFMINKPLPKFTRSNTFSSCIPPCSLDTITELTALSPVDLLVEDSSGRKVGTRHEDSLNKKYNEIPNSIYSGDGEHEFIILTGSEKEKYQTYIQATDEGDFDLIINQTRSEETNTIIYKNVPVAQKTVATTEVGLSVTENIMEIDKDGDGTTDEKRAPNVVESPSSRETKAQKPKIVVLANSIDFPLAAELFGFLRNKGLEVIHTNVYDFEHYKNEKFVVILGGPDAPEEVGSIVQEVLSEAEQDSIRETGARKKYVKTNVWTQGQRVMVIAGSDRHETKNSEDENKENIASEAESGS